MFPRTWARKALRTNCEQVHIRSDAEQVHIRSDADGTWLCNLRSRRGEGKWMHARWMQLVGRGSTRVFTAPSKERFMSAIRTTCHITHCTNDGSEEPLEVALALPPRTHPAARCQTSNTTNRNAVLKNGISTLLHTILLAIVKHGREGLVLRISRGFGCTGIGLGRAGAAATLHPASITLFRWF